jgi:hypothetical protein
MVCRCSGHYTELQTPLIEGTTAAELQLVQATLVQPLTRRNRTLHQGLLQPRRVDRPLYAMTRLGLQCWQPHLRLWVGNRLASLAFK